MCVLAKYRTRTPYTRLQWSDGGGSITAEEEGPGLIVFLRINIINVIQQSVLDEGATTPLGKIRSTSLIGAAIDRAHSGDPRSASGVPLPPRVLRSREFSRVPGNSSRRKTWATHTKWKCYLTKRKALSCVRCIFIHTFRQTFHFVVQASHVEKNL